MKSKDIVVLIVAVVILVVAGYLVMTQLSPKSSTSGQGTQIEVVGPIEPGFDDATLSNLSDTTKTQDYSVPVDLTTGLNNSAVFGQ